SPNESLDLSLRLSAGNVWRESTDHAVAARSPLFHFRILETERLPDVGLLAELRAGDIEERQREFKGRGHDSDNSEGATIRDELAPKNARIAVKLPSPEAFTDDDNVVPAFGAFFREESPPSNRLHA